MKRQFNISDLIYWYDVEKYGHEPSTREIAEKAFATREIDPDRESSKEMLEKCEQILTKPNRKRVKRKKIVITYDEDKNEYFVASGAFDLGYIFNDVTECEYPFWEAENGEIESFIIKRKMPQNPEDIFSNEVLDKIGQAFEEYYDKPSDGSAEKTDIEKVIEECFPMIKIKSLIDSIEPEYLVFNGDNISFQCSSDVCGGMLICSAYAEIQKDNLFWDWHKH